jgi:hypothetical protein
MEMPSRFLMAITLAAMVAGCGTEPLTFESLAGSFSGEFTSTDPDDDVYEGQLTLELSQAEGGVTGTWAVTGEINGFTSSEGTGPFAATIPLGPDPTFIARISYDLCPADVMEFNGTFDSSSGAMTLVGSLDIPDSQCTVLTAYPLSIVLTR